MKYFGKKVITLIMTLFLVSVAAFLAFQVIPGDVVTSILGTEATPEMEERLREELGLNDPPLTRYLHWVGDVLKGDLGVSYRYSKNMNERMPVAELIGDKLPVTLWLAFISLVLIVAVSIPLGVLWAGSASRTGGRAGRLGHVLDVSLGVITQAAMAVPSFFLGILVTYIFGIVFQVFQPGGYIRYQDNFPGFLGYLLFPALSIALPKIAMTARFLRNAMLTEMKADYVWPCAAQCHDAGGDFPRNDHCGGGGRQHCGGAGIRPARNRQAAGKFHFHQGFPGGGDLDPVYHICSDLRVLPGGYPVPGD